MLNEVDIAWSTVVIAGGTGLQESVINSGFFPRSAAIFSKAAPSPVDPLPGGQALADGRITRVHHEESIDDGDLLLRLPLEEVPQSVIEQESGYSGIGVPLGEKFVTREISVDGQTLSIVLTSRHFTSDCKIDNSVGISI
jgi:hypothetical protein